MKNHFLLINEPDKMVVPDPIVSDHPSLLKTFCDLMVRLRQFSQHTHNRKKTDRLQS